MKTEATLIQKYNYILKFLIIREADNQYLNCLYDIYESALQSTGEDGFCGEPPDIYKAPQEDKPEAEDKSEAIWEWATKFYCVTQPELSKKVALKRIKEILTPTQADTEQKCEYCKGDGFVSWQNGPDDRIGQVNKCEVCNGTGKAKPEAENKPSTDKESI